MEITKAETIEVWLTQENMTILCQVVYEDESTSDLDVSSLSMRGAQREITGHFVKVGYQPIGRWEAEATGVDGTTEVVAECSRKFRRKD